MAKRINTTFIKEIEVLDPDTNQMVSLTICKLETGGMVGIDTSFLANTEEDVYSPFDKNVKLNID